MMVQSRPHVVIVGGGIGGLFAANALIAHGLRVSVYEQAPALGEIGAGVFLTPNSVRHLQRVGLGPSVEKWGARVGHDSHYFRHDGAPIAPVQVTDSSGWNATSACTAPTSSSCWPTPCRPAWCIPDTAAPALSRTATWRGCRSPTAPAAQADVVIAADGIHSELRPHVFPPSRPVFSGLRRLSGPGAARAHSALADRPLADVARQGKALPRLSGARRKDHQLCRLRAGGRGDEGIVVGPRRPRRPSPRVRRLGPAHRAAVAAGAADVPLGAV